MEGKTMAKKFSLMMAAAAVIALTIPAFASAVEVTLPAGTRAPVGTSITGTGNDIILQSNLLGSITCENLNLNGEITKNDGTTVEGSGANTSPTQAGCKNGTKEVKITTFNITNVKSTVAGSGTATFTSIWDTGTLSCTLTGTKVPYTYAVGSNVITFSSASGITGSPAACGTGKLSGSFALEQTGTEIKLILD